MQHRAIAPEGDRKIEIGRELVGRHRVGLEAGRGCERRGHPHLDSVAHEPRGAALSMKVFALSVRLFKGFGQMNAATADLLLGEAQAVIKLLT